MPKMTFLQVAEKVLKEENKAMSPEEIWIVARERGYDQQAASRGKTPWRTIGAQLYVDVRDNPNSRFAATETRPKRFHLQEVNPKLIPAGVVDTSKPHYREEDLHQFLAYYASTYMKAYSKTIHAQRSEKKEYGEWLHPDAVGCIFSFEDKKVEAVELMSSLGHANARLLSFELKREVNFGNLREAFFQAVSNSSWANEGYLVAAEISRDEDFRSELNRLSAAFGIGVIELDVGDPDSTDVLLSARSREDVDWETVDKLSAMNPDFRDFLRRVKKDIDTQEPRKEGYDEVKTREALVLAAEKFRPQSAD